MTNRAPCLILSEKKIIHCLQPHAHLTSFPLSISAYLFVFPFTPPLPSPTDKQSYPSLPGQHQPGNKIHTHGGRGEGGSRAYQGGIRGVRPGQSPEVCNKVTDCPVKVTHHDTSLSRPYRLHFLVLIDSAQEGEERRGRGVLRRRGKEPKLVEGFWAGCLETKVASSKP